MSTQTFTCVPGTTQTPSGLTTGFGEDLTLLVAVQDAQGNAIDLTGRNVVCRWTAASDEPRTPSVAAGAATRQYTFVFPSYMVDAWQSAWFQFEVVIEDEGTPDVVLIAPSYVNILGPAVATSSVRQSINMEVTLNMGGVSANIPAEDPVAAPLGVPTFFTATVAQLQGQGATQNAVGLLSLTYNGIPVGDDVVLQQVSSGVFRGSITTLLQLQLQALTTSATGQYTVRILVDDVPYMARMPSRISYVSTNLSMDLEDGGSLTTRVSQLETEVATLTTSVAAASSAAASATTAATNATTAATAATTAATTATATAEAAATTANSAATTASNAATTASGAVTTANSAASTASAAQSAVSSLQTSVSGLATRVTAIEEGGTGGSDPSVVRGPYALGSISELTLLTQLTPAQLGLAAGQRGTLGIRVVGSIGTTVGTVRNVQVTVQNVGGVLSTPTIAAGNDITQGFEQSEAGWSTRVQLSAAGAFLQVFALTAQASSYWTVEIWLASVAQLDESSNTAETPEVWLSVASPQTTANVALRWARSVGVTGVYVSESATLPDTPTWLSSPPATFTVGGSGTRTLYYWGRLADGTVLPLKSVSVNVVLDSIAPTISAFTMPATSTTLEVAITTLTASESVEWYYNFTGVLPATPPWGAAPTSITFPDYGTYTVYMWCRDLAGNVVQTQSTQTIVVSEPVSSYYSETFATDAAAGAQFDAVYPGWTGGGGVTVNLSASSNAFVYQAIGSYGRARHMGTTALPVEYCVTWRCSNSSIADYSGFNLDVTSDGVTGFQAFFDSQSARTSWYAGHGALQYGLTGWTWTLLTGAGEGWPTSWTTDVVHQITFQVVTISATYSRVYLWIDGQRVGYWQDGATLFTAGRGFGICGEASSGRTFRSVQVTPSNVVPAYDAVSA